MTASTRIVVTVLTLAVFAVGAGCSRFGPTVTGPTVTGPTVTGPTVTGPTVTGPTVTGPTVTAPAPSATATSRSSAATPGTASWGSDPVTVRHSPSVPPVPLVTGIRYAAHPQEGFDRIVIDVRGPLPGYSVRYVSQVRADPSDRPVQVPGRRHLLLVLTPAQAHEDNGRTTVSGVHPTNLPMLASYAVVGDFEGHVSIALGLDDVVGFRVGELPGRIYLDVAA